MRDSLYIDATRPYTTETIAGAYELGDLVYIDETGATAETGAVYGVVVDTTPTSALICTSGWILAAALGLTAAQSRLLSNAGVYSQI